MKKHYVVAVTQHQELRISIDADSPTEALELIQQQQGEVESRLPIEFEKMEIVSES